MVTFLPIQTGTGDPSPTNIRPITAPLNITGIGKIWGGSFDTFTGALVEWWKAIDIGQTSWSQLETTPERGQYIFNTQASDIDMSKLIMCECYKYNPEVTNIGGLMTSINNNEIVHIQTPNRKKWIVIRDDSKKDLTPEEYQSAMNGIIATYELATPITHTLTPSQYAEVCAQLNIPATSKELLMRRRNLGAPHTATATGAVASFAGNMVAPLKECKCEFTPVQSGSGDPAPDNVRPISGWTGANVYNADRSLISFLQTTMTNSSASIYNGYAGWSAPWKLPNNRTLKYCYSAYIDNTNGSDDSRVRIWCRNKDNSEFVDGINYDGNIISVGSAGWSSIIIDVSDKPNTYYIACGARLSVGGIISNPMVEIGETRSDYTAYAGNTYAVTFPATKNLLDITKVSTTYSNVTITQGQDKVTVVNNEAWSVNVFAPIIFQLELNAKYTLSIGSAISHAIGIYGSDDGVNFEWINNGIMSGSTSATFTATKPYIRLNAYTSSGTTDVFECVQLEAGQNATAYEPYGTIYGGYVDLVSGKLMQTWYRLIADGNNIKVNSSYMTDDIVAAGIVYLNPTGIHSGGSSTIANVKCDTLSVYTQLYERYHPEVQMPYITCTNAGKQYLVFKIASRREHPEITNATTCIAFVNDWLKEHPVEIVYELYEPIEYQLTPTQLKSLKGTNNIWSNTNGNTTVTYWTH